MEVMISNQQQEITLTTEIEQAILTLGVLSAQRFKLPPQAEVAVVFLDDAAIRSYNWDYRGVDAPTDVLSFAQREETEDDVAPIPGQEELLGDILISLPRAREQSAAYGHSLAREVGFLFAHGLLHLLGYDHTEPAEEAEMFALQEELLRLAGLPRPSA
jgi:probable rRNA maturation factor